MTPGDVVAPDEVVEPQDVVVQQRQPETAPVQRSGDIRRSERQGSFQGIPWFEEMIEGSRLGRTGTSRRGVGASADGSTQVQWEVSEWTEGLEETPQPAGLSSKRKIREVGDDDLEMS